MTKQTKRQPLEVTLNDWPEMGMVGAMILRQGRFKTPMSVHVDLDEIDDLIERLRVVKAELEGGVISEPVREQDDPELALFKSAPRAVRDMVRHARTDRETYYVTPWPPRNSLSPLFINQGPQSGWSIGTESWLVTVWQTHDMTSLSGWMCAGSDDEGNRWRTNDMDEARDWLVSDPKGMPT